MRCNHKTAVNILVWSNKKRKNKNKNAKPHTEIFYVIRSSPNDSPSNTVTRARTNFSKFLSITRVNSTGYKIIINVCNIPHRIRHILHKQKVTLMLRLWDLIPKPYHKLKTSCSLYLQFHRIQLVVLISYFRQRMIVFCQAKIWCIITDKQNDVSKYTKFCCFLQNPCYTKENNESWSFKHKKEFEGLFCIL